ncbi:MAG: hypothetical protein AAGF95_26525 [Chloroflexota bacterium]
MHVDDVVAPMECVRGCSAHAPPPSTGSGCVGGATAPGPSPQGVTATVRGCKRPSRGCRGGGLP